MKSNIIYSDACTLCRNIYVFSGINTTYRACVHLVTHRYSKNIGKNPTESRIVNSVKCSTVVTYKCVVYL